MAVAIAVVIIPAYARYRSDVSHDSPAPWDASTLGYNLQLPLVLLVVMTVLGVWAAILLVASRESHTRQWTCILVVAVITSIVWIPTHFSELSVMERWLSPRLLGAAIWTEGVMGAYLVVLAYLMVRREPAPLHQTYTLFLGGVSWEHTEGPTRSDRVPRGPDEFAP
jgi:hypothetical protein